MAAVVARLPETTDLSEQQTWRQIDAGDEILRDTLNEAIIPALMTAMVHLTGKADIIRGDYQVGGESVCGSTVGRNPTGTATGNQESWRLMLLKGVSR